jgi:hypothetical protein
MATITFTANTNAELIEQMLTFLGSSAPTPEPEPEPEPPPEPTRHYGYGDTIGGRDGRILTITDNVEDTLRKALTYTKPQTIEIKNDDDTVVHQPFVIRNPYVTIRGGAFRWAHKDNLTTKQQRQSLFHVPRNHDVWLEDIKVHPGDTGQAVNIKEPDKTKAGFWETDAILLEKSHHVTLKNIWGAGSNDQCITIWGSHHISLIDTLISQTLMRSTHPDVWEWDTQKQVWKHTYQNHSMGMVCGNGSHSITLNGVVFVACGQSTRTIIADNVELIHVVTLNQVNSCIKAEGDNINVVGCLTLPNGQDTNPGGGLNGYNFYGTSKDTTAYVDRNIAPKGQVYNPDGFHLADTPFDLATDISDVKALDEAGLRELLERVGVSASPPLQNQIKIDVLQSFLDPDYKAVIRIPDRMEF